MDVSVQTLTEQGWRLCRAIQIPIDNAFLLEDVENAVERCTQTAIDIWANAGNFDKRPLSVRVVVNGSTLRVWGGGRIPSWTEIGF